MKIIFGGYTTDKIYTKDISIKAEYIGEDIVRKPNFDVIGKWNNEFIKIGIFDF